MKFILCKINGINVRLIASEMNARMMQPFIVDVRSARPNMRMQSHPGQEFIYVLSGQCRFHFGTDVLKLHEGDTLYFDSTVNHKVEPIDGESCQCVAVVTSGDFPFHGGMARLLNE